MAYEKRSLRITKPEEEPAITRWNAACFLYMHGLFFCGCCSLYMMFHASQEAFVGVLHVIEQTRSVMKLNHTCPAGRPGDEASGLRLAAMSRKHVHREGRRRREGFAALMAVEAIDIVPWSRGYWYSRLPSNLPDEVALP